MNAEVLEEVAALREKIRSYQDAALSMWEGSREARILTTPQQAGELTRRETQPDSWASKIRR